MDDYEIFTDTILREVQRRCLEPVFDAGCPAIRETTEGFEIVEVLPDDLDVEGVFPLPWLAGIRPRPEKVEYEEADLDRRLGWRPRIESSFAREVLRHVKDSWRTYSKSALYLSPADDLADGPGDELTVVPLRRRDRGVADLLRQLRECVQPPPVEAEADVVAEALDAADNVLAVGNEIFSDVEQAVLRWVREHGPIRFGDNDIRLVLEQVWHAHDQASVLERILQAGGMPALADCVLILQARMGQVRRIIGDDLFESLFYAAAVDGVSHADEILRRPRRGTSGRTTSRAFPPRRRDEA